MGTIKALFAWGTAPTALYLLWSYPVPTAADLCVSTCINQVEKLYDNYTVVFITVWGTRWRSWLRHYSTNRKVAGSIPDGDIEIFQWHNPSGRNMALGLTQPQTEMSIRNISGGVGGGRWPGRRADNLTTFMCQLYWKLGVSTSWNPQGLSRPVMGLLYLTPK